MPENWTVSVDEQTYGPYTMQQMRKFAAEGRLAPHSLIARAGQVDYQRAEFDPDIAQIFDRQTGVPVSLLAADKRQGEPARQATTFGRAYPSEGGGGTSNFLIIADLKASSVDEFELALKSLGSCGEIRPLFWLVASTHSLSAVRNTLIQKLGKHDTLFLIDVTHNKAAWINYQPEAEARFRSLWHRTPESTATVVQAG